MNLLFDLFHDDLWQDDAGMYARLADIAASSANVTVLMADAKEGSGIKMLQQSGIELRTWRPSLLDEICTTGSASAQMHAAVISWLAPECYIGVLPPHYRSDLYRYLPDFSKIKPPCYLYLPASLLNMAESNLEQLVRALPGDCVLLLDSDENASLIAKHSTNEYQLLTDSVTSLSKLCASTERTPADQTIEKPRLAFVSPLPPDESGIADYSAEILPHLSNYYQITLVTDAATKLEKDLRSSFQVLTTHEFTTVGGGFDRVLYHFGNSRFHSSYFDLIRSFPGVAVLHDVYLAHAIAALSHKNEHRRVRQEAYVTHGWDASLAFEADLQQALWEYPSFGSVFSNSVGVVVHSRHAIDRITDFIGNEQNKRINIVPLSRSAVKMDEKEVARARLKISLGDFLVCTFGVISEGKSIIGLLEAFAQDAISRNGNIRLVCVGGYGSEPYAEQIQAVISAHPQLAKVVFTGRVNAEKYRLYLAAADIAVQLRCNSRGETSAATLDCLMAGIPTIINAHGSQAELPEEAVLMLSDDFDVGELALAIKSLVDDADLRARLSTRAREYIRVHRNPETTAEMYAASIEQFYSYDPMSVRQELLHALSGKCELAVTGRETEALSRVIATIESEYAPELAIIHGRQLLVDVSALLQVDLKTGIQRVVKSVLNEILKRKQFGYRVEPVYFDGTDVRYARSFTQEFLGITNLHMADDLVEVCRGDKFLALDLYWPIVTSDAGFAILQRWKRVGVEVDFVVYDMLPMQLPDCFYEADVKNYADWFSRVTRMADGMVCISRSVADDVVAWLRQNSAVHQLPQVGFFHLGKTIGNRDKVNVMENKDREILRKVKKQPFMLMVGTVEPRKGHTHVVDAFETLWKRNSEINLVVVGKEGWKVEYIASRMNELEKSQENFFWIKDASDALLQGLYQSATAVIVASYGEGFGLPLIEASYYDTPVICRNIPVFREVGGRHAYYFSSETGVELADEIEHWMRFDHYGYTPSSRMMHSLRWENSAMQLMRVVLRGNWYFKNNRASV